MKLTNQLRALFVSRVVADINTKLDDDLVRKFVTEEAVASLPPAVRDHWNNPGLRPYVNTTYVQFESLRRSRARPAGESYYSDRNIYAPQVEVPAERGYTASAKTKARVLKMLQEVEIRMDAKEDMQARLTQMASTCKTREALEAMFPELGKYMPVEPPKNMIAPVPAVLVKDFMKELKKLGVPARSAKAEGAAA